MRRIALILTAAALALIAAAMVAGCGSSSSAGSSQGQRGAPTRLTVFAAASLTKVFPQIAADFTKTHRARSSSSASPALIRWPPDRAGGAGRRFAGASSKYGDELSGKGLIDAPQAFATNKLIVILPAANQAHIATLEDSPSRA